MSFATIMVHVNVNAASDERVRLAARLADRFRSTLIGISACMLPAYPAEGVYFVSPEFVEEERRDIAAALKRAEDGFRTVAGSGRKLEWRSSLDVPDDYLAEQARAADLVVIGRGATPADIGRAIDPGAALLKAGRPVLVVPSGVDMLRAERVVIGWKDSREARRAVRDALPFLHEAKSVTIVEVCEKGLEESGRQHVDDVARYLERHGITIGDISARTARDGAAHELISVAQSDGADLIVAGAYGHSRLGEWMFGGVTRDLLGASPVCCLMAN